jgi:hypothetical protein
MPLAVDMSSAFWSPDELAMLVEAVLNASDNDESDWIEWKSGLDLREKETQSTLARHILGMASRRPEHAARYAAGCGYIIVGAEPGRCAGVTEVDPAVLSQGMHPYLGAEGPGWAAQYVNRDGASVLVVSVEPPRLGNRIFTLCKEFPKYLAGTVFVRRQGSIKHLEQALGQLFRVKRRVCDHRGRCTVSPKLSQAPVDLSHWLVGAVHLSSIGPQSARSS